MNDSRFKLGKLPPRHDSRTLLLANYLDLARLPKPPIAVDLTVHANLDWGMMLNDKLGDCTCAAAGHLVQCWSSMVGKEATVGDDDVLKLYELACGYVPGDPSTDQGGVEIDVLGTWRKTGIGGHVISAYVAVSPKSKSHVEAGAWLFGGLYIGLALPLSSQTQEVWDVPKGGAKGKGRPGSWGGHAVCVVGYDAAGLTVVTWGRQKRMTWKFWSAYCEEAYAVLSPDFLTSGKSPYGFDVVALQADLAKVAK